VRDTGPGVAPEARARLFTPFYTTRSGGLGLGLSLSESLAQAMGGELTLAPPLLRLPTGLGPNSICSSRWHTCLERDMTSSLSPLIHLVDDDAAVRDSLALLIGTVGLRVQTWADPHVFLAEFDRSDVGAIVLDVRMPGTSGLAVLDRLVAQGVDQPVIMLTGHGTVEMCRRAFKAGAAEFLEKPVDDELLIEALQASVRQHVRSRERHQADRQARERYAQLSSRECEVLGLIVGAHQQGDRPRAVALAAHGGDPPRQPLRQAGDRLAGHAHPALRGPGRGRRSVVLRR
jgi:FixJ family two-component response regulator